MKQNIKNLMQQGRLKEAADLCKTFLGTTGQLDSEVWTLAATAYTQLGNIPEAHRCSIRAIEIAPENFEAHYILAMAEHSRNNIQPAISEYRKTIELLPSHMGAHANLGMILTKFGQNKEAAAHLETAVRAQPGNPALLHCLGNVYGLLSDFSKAEQTLRAALQYSSNNTQLLIDLGRQLLVNGKTEEAVNYFNKVLEIDKNSFLAYSNLSIAQYNLNRPDAALLNCCLALKISPDDLASRQRFAQLFNVTPYALIPSEAWSEIEKTFQHNGVDTSLLVLNSIKHIKKNTSYLSIKGDSHSLEYDKFAETLTQPGCLSLLNNGIFTATLSYALLIDLELEQLIISIRKAALYLALNNGTRVSNKEGSILLNFLSAIANQCFLNEYIYYVSDDEKAMVAKLEQEISECQAPNSHDHALTIKLVTLACYQKLRREIHNSLENNQVTSSNLPCIQLVIARQIDEPEEEEQIAVELTSLTSIGDETSRLVQEQYEESPYPRWMNIMLTTPAHYLKIFKERMPCAQLPENGEITLNMLIAGCGTGRHVAQNAALFKDVHITAVDLSKTSLSYAKRKIQEYGFDKIVDFYQADILALDSLKRSFDIIESVGVLHHMENPADGLKTLTSLLKKDGYFRIGLYSTYARRNIDAARELLLASGFRPQVDDMNAARKTIASLPENDPRRKIIFANDFYSTSGFRDLIFHTKEHTYTLLEIEELISNTNLKFLGFELANNSVLQEYRKHYPDDKHCTNLGNWHNFEKTHEDTFLGMYIFVCQK